MSIGYFKDSIIAVFGGTGSIGSEIVRHLYKQEPREIKVICNNENELWEMEHALRENLGVITFHYVDIRDFRKVDNLLLDVQYVFNCAAMKHVPYCETNPVEAVKTNILGLDNIVQAAKLNVVDKVLQISTDKAVEPSCVMGATKFIAERVCLHNSGISTKISCVRLGNVLNSRGSILPIIREKLEDGRVIPLTDERMRRYFISLKRAAQFIITCMILMEGHEIFIPKLREIYIKDLIAKEVKAAGYTMDQVDIHIVGARKGEKLREKLVSDIERADAEELEEMWVIR